MCTRVGLYDPNLLPVTLSKSSSVGFANSATFLTSSALTNNFSASISSDYIIYETTTSKLNSPKQSLKSGITSNSTSVDAFVTPKITITLENTSLINISTTDVTSNRKNTITIVLEQTAQQTASNIAYSLNSKKPAVQEASVKNAFQTSRTHNLKTLQEIGEKTFAALNLDLNTAFSTKSDPKIKTETTKINPSTLVITKSMRISLRISTTQIGPSNIKDIPKQDADVTSSTNGIMFGASVCITVVFTMAGLKKYLK
eukprot:NODE_8_length_47770_cov_0.334354.p12 type:complete len:257 gc:universal NODE_8_length_47770_cov_0.334354:21136-21906(+)